MLGIERGQLIGEGASSRLLGCVTIGKGLGLARGNQGRGQHPHPQIDQLRAELLQERSSRQDLECDKVSLERQVGTGNHIPHPSIP